MKCIICKEEVTSATEVYVRDNGKKKITVDVCDFCRQPLLAELAKQFILENWIPLNYKE